MSFDLRGKRELLWDLDMAESSIGVHINRHTPVRKNVALTCDAPWEGITCGYPAVRRIGDEYRLYYRASGEDSMAKGESFCVAYSKDGKSFYKPDLGMYDFGKCKNTNIHHREERFIDNFSIHYDDNPDCPDDEKFKALSLVFDRITEKKCTTELALYKSADGIKFEFVRILSIKGVFDTYNVLLWNDKEKTYRIYLRDFHNQDGSECVYEPTDAMNLCIRDIRISKSKDLINWTAPEKLSYGEGAEDLQLYTNQIIKYPRADIYFGMPTRYVDRRDDKASFKYLFDKNNWRSELLAAGNRIGSAITDCVLMYSRDGKNFKRDNNAFASPQYEEGRNWLYGDCYFSHGIVETVSDENPDVTEYSMYVGEGYRQKTIEFIRYTVRLDGFYSLRSDYDGGELVTDGVTLGDEMYINFSTSALGSVRIAVCDMDGKLIDGYDSGVLFGNSVRRRVDFARPLSELSGREVRLKISLKDADIYSIGCDV